VGARLTVFIESKEDFMSLQLGDTVLDFELAARVSADHPMPPTPPQLHPARLVFSSSPEPESSEPAGIYSINADGSDRRLLSQTLEGPREPIWSPNGQRLAFAASNADIYTVNADGSQLTQIFAADYGKGISTQMAWLANSQQLAFVQSCDGFTLEAPGTSSLYLSDTTGTAGTRLIQTWESWYDNTKVGLRSNFAFSSDGQQVAFVNDQDTYKINADGSGLIQLTDQIGRDDHNFSQVFWSPNGVYLARVDIFTDTTSSPQGYILKSDGTLMARLHDPQTNWNSTDFAWSPDGNQLIYVCNDLQSTPSIAQDLCLLNVPEHQFQLLTAKLGNYELVTWSPQAQQIAFTLRTSQSVQLYTLTLADLKLTQLTRSPLANIAYLTWSPDGQQLAFSSTMADQQTGLWVVDRHGAQIKQVTQNENIYNPSWQPEGMKIR
jgi:Tol biopolymer transport system component